MRDIRLNVWDKIMAAYVSDASQIFPHHKELFNVNETQALK